MKLGVQTRRLGSPSLAIGRQSLREGLLDLVPRDRMFFLVVIARQPRYLGPLDKLTLLFSSPAVVLSVS